MARTKSEARREAEEVVNKWALGLGTISIVPGASAIAGVAGFPVMARNVADIYGVGVFNEKALANHLGVMLLGGASAAAVMNWLPGINLFSGLVMGGVTKAIGEGTIDYFEEESPLPD